ncbi:MAG: PKD domain-containing protein, partial [Halobacteria archaeon]
YGHVGIYLGNGSIIHAYGAVKVNTVEEALGKLDIGQYLGWSYPPETWRPSSIENHPPIANAGQDWSVFSGDVIVFNASESHDPDGTITNYRWDFGDGASAEGMTTNHRFRGAQNEPKTYTVTLTVEDNRGAKATDIALVTVKPLTKLVDVGSGSFGVSCWMKATYNWVGIDEATGENLYIISKIETYSGGISGAYQLFILRRISPPPPYQN